MIIKIITNIWQILKNQKFKALFFAVSVVIIGGAAFYHHFEGWRWLDSVYFCFITLTTIGFGDLTPKTDIGKVFTIFYVLMGIGLILGFITAISDYLLKQQLDRRVDSFLFGRLKEKLKGEENQKSE